jgi:GMP synthase PP-ATPase subunit
MRLNECEQVQKDLSEALGINLTVVDASQEFLGGLKGLDDPEVGTTLLPSCYWSRFLNPICRKSASSSVCLRC